MFQNKKLKRNATYAIAEVAEIGEVALCASNRALPISVKYRYKIRSGNTGKYKNTNTLTMHLNTFENTVLF